MAAESQVEDEDLLSVVTMARDLLPKEIAVVVKAQEHPGLIQDLIEAGVDDLGSVSVRLKAPSQPKSWQNILSSAEKACENLRCKLSPRLPIHPSFCSAKFLPKELLPRIKQARKALKAK